MKGFAWESAVMLNWLWAVPLLALLLVRAGGLRRRALALFAAPETSGILARELSERRRRVKSALMMTALVLASLALARPSWLSGEPPPQGDRDILVLLDVSRSMQARDLEPNRLLYAKRGLNGLIAHLRGDRIGLVAFAGSAALRCPLTSDYDFFRAAVADATPATIARGGTEIAAAIRVALEEGFDDLSKRSRHIVIVTDAEDHGHGAVAAAEEAVRRRARVSVVGLGDERTGARVPIDTYDGERFLTYRGEEVWSRLNTAAVRLIAQAGRGEPGFAGNSGTDLAAELAGVISTSRARSPSPRTQGFGIALALAVISLAAGLAISERRAA